MSSWYLYFGCFVDWFVKNCPLGSSIPRGSSIWNFGVSSHNADSIDTNLQRHVAVGLAHCPLSMLYALDNVINFGCSNGLPVGTSHHLNQCWFHYDDVIMGAMASQITSLTIVYSTVYSNPCEFPAQMASNAEKGSISWRHHELSVRPLYIHPTEAISIERTEFWLFLK